MRPPRNIPRWSSCMVLSARHFSLGKKHLVLGFRHFLLGSPVRKVANANAFQRLGFPNRLNNRLLKSIGDYAMLRPLCFLEDGLEGRWKVDWRECFFSTGEWEYSLPKCPRRHEWFKAFSFTINEKNIRQSFSRRVEVWLDEKYNLKNMVEYADNKVNLLEE